MSSDARRPMIWAALVVLTLDQASKQMVVEVMNLRHLLQIDIAPPYLRFLMAWNQGINFGLGASGADWVRWLLAALAVGVSAFLARWAGRKGGWWMGLGAGLVIGGAIGNAIDRVRYGAVADFLNMSCCGFNNPYAFNVADIAIFGGAGVLIMVSGDRDGKDGA